jgi:hypothetical protein
MTTTTYLRTIIDVACGGCWTITIVESFFTDLLHWEALAGVMVTAIGLLITAFGLRTLHLLKELRKPGPTARRLSPLFQAHSLHVGLKAAGLIEGNDVGDDTGPHPIHIVSRTG